MPEVPQDGCRASLHPRQTARPAARTSSSSAPVHSAAGRRTTCGSWVRGQARGCLRSGKLSRDVRRRNTWRPNFLRRSRRPRRIVDEVGESAIDRWATFDAEWGREMKVTAVLQHRRLHLSRGSLRRSRTPRRSSGSSSGIPFEVLNPEDVAREYPRAARRHRVRAARPAGRRRARAPSVEVVAEAFRHSGGEVMMGHAALGDRDGDRLQRSENDRTRCDPYGCHVRACARALVSEGVTRADGLPHPHTARARPLLRHPARGRPIHVSEYPELQLSRRDWLGRVAARQPRFSRTTARRPAHRSGHERSGVRSQQRRTRTRLHRRPFSSARGRRYSRRERATTR